MAPKVFFVLGGPGSGKGTACGRLVKNFGYTHFCAGDLLREAAKNMDTDVAKKIATIIGQGNIVPSEITVELLRTHIAATPNSRGYLLDGFPRKMDQAQMFEEGIAQAEGILFFDCTVETMEKRLLARAAAGSTRTDDNVEVMRNRFKVNEATCQPVVDHYTAAHRCFVVDANQDTDGVYSQVVKILESLGEKPVVEGISNM